jgi:predicted dithiol-disulfide oxidoreductase (DUF899 family)
MPALWGPRPTGSTFAFDAILHLDRVTPSRLLAAERACDDRHQQRESDRVFETYWTTLRGVEAMDHSYALMDLTVYGRQELWEASPPGWPQQWQEGPARMRTNGRPIAQWSRLEAGRSDDLAVGR